MEVAPSGPEQSRPLGSLRRALGCENIVRAGLAKKCEVQVAYAIGIAAPVSVHVDTFGTGKADDRDLEKAVARVFDLRPSAIIRDLDLLKPQYRKLAAYGHLGREDLGVQWEETNRIQELLKPPLAWRCRALRNRRKWPQ